MLCLQQPVWDTLNPFLIHVPIHPYRRRVGWLLLTVLFLGTEKYPEEGQFENFLTQHGGSSNAVSSRLYAYLRTYTAGSSA